jgi:hypothetical protein
MAFEDTESLADTHGRGYDNFNHHERKAQTAKVRGNGGNTPTAISSVQRRMTFEPSSSSAGQVTPQRGIA